MGLTHGFIRIRPETFRKASAQLASPPRTMADATRVAATFSRKLTEFQSQAMADAYEEDMAEGVAQLFEVIVTEQDYYIDKSWRHGLGPVCRQIPSLQGLVGLFDYEHSDMQLPSFMKNEAGLTMIWSHKAIAPIAASLEPISGIPELQTLAASAKFSIFDRMRGRPNKYATDVAGLTDEYSIENWKVLRAAICDTAAAQHYLGLIVSF